MRLKVIGIGLFLMVDALLQRFYTADDFHDFAGNLRLSRSVVSSAELLDHVTGIFGS